MWLFGIYIYLCIKDCYLEPHSNIGCHWVGFAAHFIVRSIPNLSISYDEHLIRKLSHNEHFHNGEFKIRAILSKICIHAAPALKLSFILPRVKVSFAQCDQVPRGRRFVRPNRVARYFTHFATFYSARQY